MKNLQLFGVELRSEADDFIRLTRLSNSERGGFMSIRNAVPTDVPAMLEIYAYFVRETAVSFEYEVPTQEEFARRLAEDLGVKVNFISTEAANRIEYLKTGKVDVILANFTVTPARAEEVDFALPYMNVAMGVVSPEGRVITTLEDWDENDEMIVISGTTAETYLTKEYPDIPLQKYDSYATAKNALENGNGAAWANDNTEVIAFAKQNSGYTVGIPSLGSQDTIAPAVSKGNTTLLDWINDEIKALGNENFFHADYEATLLDTYGKDYEDTLVVGGGAAAGAEVAETVTEKGTITVAASPTPHAEITAAPSPQRKGSSQSVKADTSPPRKRERRRRSTSEFWWTLCRRAFRPAIPPTARLSDRAGRRPNSSRPARGTWRRTRRTPGK